MSPDASMLERLEQVAGRRVRLTVPELGSSAAAPLAIWARPLTAYQMGEIRRALADADDPTVWARILWTCAETEDGARAFGDIAWPRFLRLIPQTVAHRLGAAIYGVALAEVEGAEGNSPATRG